MFDSYGPPEVLRVREVPRPEPGRGQVLIRVFATTVTNAECQMRQGKPVWGRPIIGLLRPRRRTRTLGMELAGEIAAVGPGVTRFRAGEQVYGFTAFSLGAYAEYACLPETASLSPKPANLPHELAVAAVDGASTALFFLRDLAGVRPGQRVLVNGAAGSIGTYAVQLAKHLGAHVTGVCSAGNAELVTSLGADRVVDYRTEDFTAGPERYDVVFDAVGKSSFRLARRALAPTGVYLSTTGLWNIVLAVVTRLRPGPKVRAGMSVRKHEALAYLRELLERDGLRIVVDREYTLEEIVEAHRYVETGHKRGNVVVTV
jgi:NADPH:quinone reductase-like Zn-dependent oxidoreductase